MDKPLRLLIGQISHETNTFSPIATDLGKFGESRLVYGEQLFTAFRNTRTTIAGFMDAAREAEEKQGIRIELIPSVSASATPSGIVTREAYEQLLGALLGGVERARWRAPLDGVLLALHGAMVVEGITDAEGDTLERVRRAVGPEVPVMATLDLHANLSEKMVRNANALFGYDSYPHVDYYERGVEQTRCMLDTVTGKVRPTMALRKPPLMPPIITQRTEEGPLAHLFEMARRFEAQPGVINLSVFGGFPFSDIPEVGLAVVAATDNDPALAARIATAVADEAWAIREQFVKPAISARQAVAHAMSPEAQAAGKPGPIVLADIADNPGAGGSGDTTELLRTLLEMGAQDVGFAVMWDPEAARAARQVGVGATLAVVLGGKTEVAHGAPVHVQAKVLKLTDGSYLFTGPMMTGLQVSVGPTALLEAGGVQIIVTSDRAQPFDPEIFRHVGIDPASKRILAVKSTVHFRAAYTAIAREILEVDCPGMAMSDPSLYPYKNVPRPLFPLDRI